jgi:hypothetical protein
VLEPDLNEDDLRDYVHGVTGGAIATSITVAAVAGAGQPIVAAPELGLVRLLPRGSSPRFSDIFALAGENDRKH